MYSEKIMEAFYNPEHYGVIKGADAVGKIVSDIGNEIIKIFIKVEDNKIVDAQFQTFGGVVAIAVTCIATNFMIGKSISSIKKLTEQDLLALTGEVPENKMYLVTAVSNVMHLAIENYTEKN